MSIKTDAMIAHNGADGYTLHVDYDPDTDEIVLKAVFNDGTVKEIEESMSQPSLYQLLAERGITVVDDKVSTRLGSNAFSYCTMMERASFEKAQTIRSSAFLGCSIVKYILLPAATSIAASTFANCAQLEYVYIGSNCASVSANCMSGTKDGIVIDCGFSADSAAAANAPWGSTNATINYDVAEPNPPVGLSMAPDPGLIQSIDLEPLEDIQPVEEPVLEVKKTTRKAAK